MLLAADAALYPCYRMKQMSLFSLKVYTWGDNDEGQLGDGTTTGIQKPRLVAALQVFISFQKSNGGCNHVTSADTI
jgi:alpha-tubulin suppressor-like RCC1 family protein